MNLRNKFAHFMIGRYGMDDFSKAMIIFAFILYAFNLFLQKSLLSTLFMLLVFYCYFRMFSRNTYKRSSENQMYLQKTVKLRRSLSQYVAEFKGRKTHHIYKCPTCKQKIRVPRGKGNISIHCPKCHADFIKNS